MGGTGTVKGDGRVICYSREREKNIEVQKVPCSKNNFDQNTKYSMNKIEYGFHAENKRSDAYEFIARSECIIPNSAF